MVFVVAKAIYQIEQKQQAKPNLVAPTPNRATIGQQSATMHIIFYTHIEK